MQDMTTGAAWAAAAIILAGIGLACVIFYMRAADDDAQGAPRRTVDNVVMSIVYAAAVTILLACAFYDFFVQRGLPPSCGYDFVSGFYHVDEHGMQHAGCPAER